MATTFREPNMVKWIGVRPGHEGEEVLINVLNAATAVLYTVPADKILLLYDWYLSLAYVGAASCQVNLRNDAAAIIGNIANFDTCAGNNTAHIAQNLTIPIELLEDYDIRIVTGVTVRGYIHGILIDA